MVVTIVRAIVETSCPHYHRQLVNLSSTARRASRGIANAHRDAAGADIITRRVVQKVLCMYLCFEQSKRGRPMSDLVASTLARQVQVRTLEYSEMSKEEPYFTQFAQRMTA